MRCYNVSSMHKHIQRKISRKRKREKERARERKWKKKQLKPNRVKNVCFDFLKQRFIPFCWMSFIFGLFFLHFTKIKIHYTLVHLIICTRFFIWWIHNFKAKWLASSSISIYLKWQANMLNISYMITTFYWMQAIFVWYFWVYGTVYHRYIYQIMLNKSE